MQDVNTITIHYSATYEDQDITAAIVDQWHRDRGFKMIGYNFFLRRSGLREIGRPLDMVGAHVAGQNSGNIGICWAGGLNRATGPNVGVDNRTPEQTHELIRLIKELLHRWPNARVVGHNDLANTQCPGFDVPAWWAGVISGKAIEGKKPDEKAPVRTPGVREDAFHVVEPGETWFSISRDYGLAPEQLATANGASVMDILQIGRKLDTRPPAQVAPVEIERPKVPQEIEKDVRKQTNRFGWITTLGGLAGTAGAYFANMNWQTVAAVGVVAIVGVTALAILGPLLARSVRRIREEVER